MTKRYKLIPPSKPIIADPSEQLLDTLKCMGFKVEEIKPERREFWVLIGSFTPLAFYTEGAAKGVGFDGKAPIHVTEIFDGERVLSREDVIDACAFANIENYRDVLYRLGFEDTP